MTLAAAFLAAAARAADAVAAVIAAAPARPAGRGGADTDVKALDEAAEAVAVEALAVLGLPILSEEAGVVDGARPGEGDPWIALDPIDGTRNCLHGYPPWSVAIGLVRDGEPVAGYVVDLSCGRRWWSGDGPGAFCDGRPIRTRVGGLVVLPSTDPRDLVPFDPGPLYPRARLAGSTAVDLCRVADGSAGAFVDVRRAISQAHDIAGSLAILRAAGGAALDPAGEPIVLAADVERAYHLVAAADAEEAGALVRRLRPAEASAPAGH